MKKLDWQVRPWSEALPITDSPVYRVFVSLVHVGLRRHDVVGHRRHVVGGGVVHGRGRVGHVGHVVSPQGHGGRAVGLVHPPGAPLHVAAVQAVIVLE